MVNIIRRDPLRDAYSMNRAFDRMLDRAFGEFGMEWDEPLKFSLPLDVIEKENEFIVTANVAGFDPEKIDITYTNNALTIKGEMQEEKESKEEGRYHLKERRVGSFFRTISMPGLIDSGKIDAEIDNGILTLHLPKKEEAQPKRIEVKAKNVNVIDSKTK
jgi:HSP20 family molecular chaperone IbpA